MNEVNSSRSLASSWQKAAKAVVSFHSLTGASCKRTPRSRRAVWYVCNHFVGDITACVYRHKHLSESGARLESTYILV